MRRDDPLRGCDMSVARRPDVRGSRASPRVGAPGPRPLDLRRLFGSPARGGHGVSLNVRDVMETGLACQVKAGQLVLWMPTDRAMYCLDCAAIAIIAPTCPACGSYSIASPAPGVGRGA